MDDPFGPIIITIVAFVLSFVVRLAEAAVPYLDEGELRRLAEGESTRAQRAVRMIERAERPFGAYRMTWAGLFVIGWASLNRGVGGRLDFAPAPWPRVLLMLLYALAAFSLAGVAPGHVAAHGRDRLFDRIAPMAEVVLWLFTPLTRLSELVGDGIVKPFHLNGVDSGELVTEEDILEMVDKGEEKGAIESDEKEMIENIFEFNNMNAGDCMVHRKDITAIDIDSTDEQIMDTIRESGRSRFPVYEGSLDNVQGILFTRDYLLDKCEGKHTPLRQLIRPAHFVPESVRTDVLFKEMQRRKQHLAIVVDEYGGTSGLITMEDLLEEIVGNIYDEYDKPLPQEIQKIGDNQYRIAGGALIEVINDALDLKLPTGAGFESLGGLIFSRMMTIPKDGSHPVVECCGLRIRAEEIVDRRVEWATVTVLDTPQEKEEEKEENPAE